MKKWLPITLIVIVSVAFLAAIGFAGYKFLKSRNAQVPGIGQKEAEKLDSAEKKKERKEKQEVLIEIIKELFSIEAAGTSFSLAVYDLKHNEYFGVNDTEPQHAASVSKVLTAVYVLDQVEKGKANLADPLGAYNVEFQLEKTVNQSDPETWAFLDEKFKPADQNKFAKSIGLKNTDIRLGKNLMAPKDVAILLQKLADGQLLKDTSRDKLFTYMQNTESENFFSPSFKLAGLTFYHKTGKFDAEAHDAAIIQHSENPFVLVVFSVNNTNLDPNTRAPVMQKVASAVVDYFDTIN
ncbi:MAG: serine hydrolase [Candidatus Woykebacteria bacterium]